MTKSTYRLTFLLAATGLLFLIPASLPQWLSYSYLKIVHIALGFLLAVTVARVIYTHVPEVLGNPFKRGIKKWNGFKLLFYLTITFISGILLIFLSGHAWIRYVHLFIGLWCLLVGWKHTR